MVKNDLKKIKLVNVKIAFKIYKKDTSGFIGNVISLITNSMYYHTELIIGNYWVSSNPETNCVSITNLRELNNNWYYHDLGYIELTQEQYENLITFIKEQKNCKYDWLAIIFSQLLPFRQHSKNKWFCSEIVTKLLQLMLVPQVNYAEPSDISPADLAKLFNCNKPRFNK